MSELQLSLTAAKAGEELELIDAELVTSARPATFATDLSSSPPPVTSALEQRAFFAEAERIAARAASASTRCQYGAIFRAFGRVTRRGTRPSAARRRSRRRRHRRLRSATSPRVAGPPAGRRRRRRCGCICRWFGRWPESSAWSTRSRACACHTTCPRTRASGPPAARVANARRRLIAIAALGSWPTCGARYLACVVHTSAPVIVSAIAKRTAEATDMPSFFCATLRESSARARHISNSSCRTRIGSISPTDFSVW